MTHKTCDLCGSSEYVGTHKIPPNTFLSSPLSLFGDMNFQANYDYDLPKIHVLDICKGCREKAEKVYKESFGYMIDKSRKEYAK